jgi:o-succinylbenzoate---CoA ligase
MFNFRDRDSIAGWIYELCCQRLADGWLVGKDGMVSDVAKTIRYRADLKIADYTENRSQFITISTLDPIEFIATLMAGCKLGLPIFLGNSGWGTVEWEQVSQLTARVDPAQHRELLMIPTGGSSGAVKFAMHTWATLGAAVAGFQDFYEVENINAVCTLPLYHVSGLMQLCRSLLTGGKLVIIDFHEFCTAPELLTKQLGLEDYFISLVPTQLTKLLDLEASWLSRFQTILLGGAPPSNELLDRARSAQLPIALTYGMTETASQVTSLKPAEFLAGNHSCGKALPHAKIELITDLDLSHNSPQIDRVASLRIRADSLMLGYFPDLHANTYFEPDDLGKIDKDGDLTIVGRTSSKIISGGENILPIEVVEAIMATGLVADVWVVGVPDLYWGQVVTAVYVAGEDPVSDLILSKAIAGKISKYKIPKYWVSVDRIPRNALGKVLINEVENIARAAR